MASSLQQLVGVPLTSEYTHVTAMRVSPEDYREWFEDNVMWSYFDSEYPWTQLGYTYDRSVESQAQDMGILK